MTKQQANGNRAPRDAIVMSGWGWNCFNVPERVALALAQLGAKILYCQNPVSRFRNGGGPMTEVHPGIFRLTPEFLGHRLNRIPVGLNRLQAKIAARQIMEAASNLGLRDPLLIYPHGDFFAPLCREFKNKGFRLIHGCFDYPEPGQDRHIELSDLTLTLSRTIFHQLKAKYGEKIALIPEVRWLPDTSQEASSNSNDEFLRIPRPRLGYIGPVTNRLNLGAVQRLLASHPNWQFVHFGESKCLALPNVHLIPWRDPTKLTSVIANLDVGFMPYDCHSNKNFHCMPLKVFDYFLAGLPVVSTPIVNLWEYSDTIYFGDDAEELARAIQLALGEPPDSPRRVKRMEIAHEHSIEALAESLSAILLRQQLPSTALLTRKEHCESIGLAP